MNLREARSRKLLSIRELAQASGVGVSTIAFIEAGKVLPSLRTVRKLAEALQLEPMEVDESQAAIEKSIRGKVKAA